jgi:capsular exopolysaccharide synthesis family protein
LHRLYVSGGSRDLTSSYGCYDVRGMDPLFVHASLGRWSERSRPRQVGWVPGESVERDGYRGTAIGEGTVASEEAEATIDLGRLLRTLFRHRWTILSVALVTTGLAAAYSFTRTPTYTARAVVLVQPVLASPLEGRFDQVDMPTEIEIARSGAVAQLAASLLGGGETGRELLARLSVENPAGSDILEISFSHPDPDVARDGAQAFAEAYLRFRSEQAGEAIQRNATALRDELARIDAEIASIDEQLAEVAEGSTRWRTLSDRRRQLEANRLALQAQLISITALSTDPGRVIEAAQRPARPSSPRHPINVALGMIAGIVAGAAVAHTRERLGERMVERTVVERCLRAPTLGLIPKARALRGAARLAVVEDPRGPVAEAYRTLRTNLLAVARRPPLKSLLITSADMGEGKSTTAANLAAALAQVERSVVLVSADLRFPRAHAFFGMPNERGLVQVLKGTLPLSDALVDTGLPGLRVLPSGPVIDVDEPVELLQSDRMREVIEGCEADFVLVDGPPILPVADSLVLAGMVDGVLLVIDARNATGARVADPRHQIQQVGGRIIGGVLNRVHGWVGRARYRAYDYRRGLLYRVLLAEQLDLVAASPPRRDDGGRSLGS